MPMNEDKKAGHIQLLLTGGNIGLIATVERSETVLKVASPSEFKKFLFNSEDGNSLLLREGSLAGRSVQVEIHDLRQATDRRFSDPEEFDSAQVDPKLWAQIAETIKSNYDKYEGFVVLHGLDTMAYTASAISFMLKGLRSPVIFAGSQRPLNFARTDALQNIFSAITLAASGYLGLKPIIREVTVYSYDTLFRANRASMVSASSYRTYDSPNFPSIATVGEHIEIQSHLVRAPDESKMLIANTKVDAEVVILDVFPGMRPAIINGLARNVERAREANNENVPIRGVLLRTYGMGTAPTSSSVLDALQKLNESDIVVMNVTQARSGRISHGQDPVSLRLFEQGVISGVDMTAEAAYAKMVVLLSQVEDFHEVSDLLQLERAGEQSQSIFHIHFDANQTREDDTNPGIFQAILSPRPVNEVHLLRSHIGRVSYIQLRLLGLEPVTGDNKPVSRTIELDVSLVDPDGPANSEVARLKSDLLRWVARGRRTINMAYDITDAKDRLLSLDKIPSTRVRLRTNEMVRWKRASIAIFTTVEDSVY